MWWIHKLKCRVLDNSQSSLDLWASNFAFVLCTFVFCFFQLEIGQLMSLTSMERCCWGGVIVVTPSQLIDIQPTYPSTSIRPYHECNESHVPAIVSFICNSSGLGLRLVDSCHHVSRNKQECKWNLCGFRSAGGKCLTGLKPKLPPQATRTSLCRAFS